MKDGRKILVTGATGKQGGAVARELLARGYRVRAMTRQPKGEKAQALAQFGAEVIRGDLDDPASLAKAIKGVWGVFSVQNTWEAGVAKEEEQGKRFARISKDAGVQHFVYSSVASAHRNTGIPHFENKWWVEETVRSLHFPSYMIIRPVFFMENFLSPWFKPGLDQGKLAMAIKPTTVLQMIAVEDIGKYGAWAFDHHEALNGRAIDIAGDAKTMPETARIIGSAAGRKIEFVQTPIEEVRKYSEDYALMLEWFDAVGYDVDIQGLAKESGIRPTTFAEWAAKVDWSWHQFVGWGLPHRLFRRTGLGGASPTLRMYEWLSLCLGVSVQGGPGAKMWHPRPGRKSIRLGSRVTLSESAGS